MLPDTGERRDMGRAARDDVTQRFLRAYVRHALAGRLPRRRFMAVKRALDLAMAIPLWLLSAPAVALTTVWLWARFHRRATTQVTCAGRDAQIFTLSQFRLTSNSLPSPQGDAWLSASRLAKYPALAQVLSGRMSLVGPAPMPVAELASVTDLARLYRAPGLLRLRPVGKLARLASTQQEADLAYIAHGSLPTDLGQLWAALFLRSRRFAANAPSAQPSQALEGIATA